MPPSTSQSSFIPKRGKARVKTRKPVRQIFIFSILAYSAIFGALIAAGGSYFYKEYLTGLRDAEIIVLDTLIDDFSISGLAEVSEYDLRLKRAADRFNNSASVVTVLQAIETSAIQPVQIQSLDVERVGDDQLAVVGSLVTADFDGALFQRKRFASDRSTFSDVLISDVSISDDSSAEQSIAGQQIVTFTATLGVPIEKVPYVVRVNSQNQPSVQNQLPLSDATDINEAANQLSL